MTQPPYDPWQPNADQYSDYELQLIEYERKMKQYHEDLYHYQIAHQRSAQQTLDPFISPNTKPKGLSAGVIATIVITLILGMTIFTVAGVGLFVSANKSSNNTFEQSVKRRPSSEITSDDYNEYQTEYEDVSREKSLSEKYELATYPVTYFSREELQNLYNIVDDSKSIQELETNVNKALYSQPFDGFINGILGRNALRFLLTQRTVEETKSVARFDGLYTLPSVSTLDETKLSVHNVISQYARYPLKTAGRMAGDVILGHEVKYSKNGGKDSIVGGLTSRTILLNIDILSNTENSRYEQFALDLVNHEILHAFDQLRILDSSLSSGESDPDIALEVASAKIWDPWSALNTNGKDAYDNKSYSEAITGIPELHPKEGFVDDYGFINPAEDRAMVFEYLMSKSGRKALAKWTKSDKVLQAKIDFITNELKEFGIEPIGDLYTNF